jgi:hypothetical protein
MIMCEIQIDNIGIAGAQANDLQSYLESKLRDAVVTSITAATDISWDDADRRLTAIQVAKVS